MFKADIIEKRISGRVILAPCSVELQPGTVTTVLGPNGAGKSTLLRCLSMIDPPDQGMILIDEFEYRFPKKNGGNIPSPWPHLTAVFQGLHLWPNLTLRKNILLPLEANRKDIDLTAFQKITHRFDLVELLDRFPSEVSGGERQRAAIARAIMLAPRYLLLDEPTASADISHTSILAEVIRELASTGCTLLVVTHMLGFARTIADHVLFMDDGAIVESGGPSVLTCPAHPTLQRFVSLH